MEIVYNLLLVLHFLGLASLIGGWLVQMRARGERVVNPAMVHGALTQVVTGVLLVGLAESVDELETDIDNAKIGVKLVVALVVLGLTWVNRRKARIPDGLHYGIGGLAVLNVVVAVFW